MYLIFLNVFFYKDYFYKNNFYKNIFMYYNFLSINFFKNNQTSFNIFYMNYFLLNNSLKLSSNQFLNQYDLLIKSYYLDSENILDSNDDEIKDDFNLIFLKKNKFFFYKNLVNPSLINNNTLINLISFLIFNQNTPHINFFKKNNTNPYCKNNHLQSYKPFFYKICLLNFYIFGEIFLKKKNFYKNIKIKYNFTQFINLNKIFFKTNSKYSVYSYFFKKNNLFFSKFKNNNNTLDKYFFEKSKLKSNLSVDFNFDFSQNDFFFKNFFFKNFFYFCGNLISSKSTVFLNSYFYNSFFENNFNSLKLTSLTNYTPYNLIKGDLVNKIFSKLNINYVPSFYRYIYYGVSSSIEFLLKKKIFLKIFSKSIKDNFVIDQIDNIFLKNRSVQSRIGRGFFLHEMLDILYMTFFYKDLNFLIKWFVKTMNRISFLNHKKFISSFKQIIINNSDFFIKNNDISGFFFDIRGKVGVTGDAKKRHFSFYVGDFSKTVKKYKFDYQFDIVRTYTGALGITMYLSYK